MVGTKAARTWALVAVSVAVLSAAACQSGQAESTRIDEAMTTTTTTSTTSTTTTTLPPTTVPRATLVVDPDGRTILQQDGIQFAVAAGVSVFYPSARVERIGFHQSNHEGAQQIDPLPDAMSPVVMTTRDRLSGDRSAADVVSDPTLPVRAPVTGTVVAANVYTLYCTVTDELVFIVPDEQPGFTAKVLHLIDVQVAPGDRVIGGQTVIAAHPHQLPFGSQVDDYRAVDPPWSHVHIEVVDPSIPDIPNPGSGSDC